MKFKKTIIHINKNIIQQNNKRGTKLPVCRVELNGKTWYGSKNEDVIFTLYENARDKIGQEHNLKTGHFYYTDVSKPHAVRNNSNTDRIHLVVDCHGNSVFRSVIA
jgi:hypothetical protein